MIQHTPTLDLRSYNREVTTHQHDYHQLVLPVSGRLNMYVGADQGDVSPQHVAVIHAGQDHDFSSAGDNCFLVADIPSALAPELAVLPPFIPVDDVLAQYVVFLHSALLQGKANKNSERQMLLLLIQLLRERFGGSGHQDQRIETARAYIDQYFSETITLTDLAGLAHLSTRQLSQLFRQHVGMTPQQYQLEKRMQLGWQMLDGGGHTMQHIAESVGYKSLAAFSDRFRRHFGHSPRHIRQIDK